MAAATIGSGSGSGSGSNSDSDTGASSASNQGPSDSNKGAIIAVSILVPLFVINVVIVGVCEFCFIVLANHL